MSEQPIKAIFGMEPMREGEYPLTYQVGFCGVTKIVPETTSPEPYCERTHYYVWKGEHLHSRVSDAAVSEVLYSEIDELTEGQS